MEISIVNSVTTMHNQEKEEMINKLKADLEQQQLNCSKTSELDTNLQTLNNHLEKLVTMNTDLSEKLQKNYWKYWVSSKWSPFNLWSRLEKQWH